MNTHFLKGDKDMANKHIEHKGSVSLVMREMQSCRHSAMALHTLWMAPVKRTNGDKYQRGRGEVGSLIQSWRECNCFGKQFGSSLRS